MLLRFDTFFFLIATSPAGASSGATAAGTIAAGGVGGGRGAGRVAAISADKRRAYQYEDTYIAVSGHVYSRLRTYVPLTDAAPTSTSVPLVRLYDKAPV